MLYTVLYTTDYAILHFLMKHLLWNFRRCCLTMLLNVSSIYSFLDILLLLTFIKLGLVQRFPTCGAQDIFQKYKKILFSRNPDKNFFILQLK